METIDTVRSNGRGTWSPDGWTYYGKTGVQREDVVNFVRRSSMIMPVNVDRFVEKAWTRGADAIVLDLEDSVTHAQKNAARAMVRDAIPVVAKGGADVLVRINKPFEMAVADLDASIWPGLAGIHFPKAETPEEIRILDRMIAEREMARDMPVGSVQISIAIRDRAGPAQCACHRDGQPAMVAIALGAEDYTLDMDIEPSRDGKELFLGKMQTLVVARLAGVQALGTLASMADFTDVERVTRLAREARQVGYRGASCIHPASGSATERGILLHQEEIAHATEGDRRLLRRRRPKVATRWRWTARWLIFQSRSEQAIAGQGRGDRSQGGEKARGNGGGGTCQLAVLAWTRASRLSTRCSTRSLSPLWAQPSDFNTEVASSITCSPQAARRGCTLSIPGEKRSSACAATTRLATSPRRWISRRSSFRPSPSWTPSGSASREG